MKLREVKIYMLEDWLIATELTPKAVETLLTEFKAKYREFNIVAFQKYVNTVKEGRIFQFIYLKTAW